MRFFSTSPLMKISRSSLLAIGLALIVVLWMASGLLTQGSTPLPVEEASLQPQQQRAPIAVRVMESLAGQVSREVTLSARSEPNRVVSLSAETDGRIVSIDATRGARVKAGQTLVSIDVRDRELREAEAQALVRQRELEYEAAQRMRGREFFSASQIAESESLLASARANLARIQQDLERTRITAPFDGILEERSVELGHFVGIGDPIATLVDMDPLIISGDLSERDIQQLDAGSKGIARLRDGSEVQGLVRYVAPVASESTRTFKVELSIPNPDYRLRAGTSAQVRLPAGEIRAHRLSPALLTLGDDGEIGVKAVDEDNRVVFYPVEIAMSNNQGTWVTGLPERLQVIAVGQGFVVAGERVDPLPMEETLLPGGGQAR